MSRFLRQANPDEEQHASNLELFYDLVFVFAVTQVSHLLLADLTWRAPGGRCSCSSSSGGRGTTRPGSRTSSTRTRSVRLLVLAIMLASLIMAVAIPAAFGSRALLFVGAYVAIQSGGKRS